MWSGNVKTALSNLRTSKWRSTLSMFGIIIGVSSVITVVSLGKGLQNQILGQINQLGSSLITVRSGELISRDPENGSQSLNLLAFFSPSTLTEQDVEALNQLNSAEAVVPMSFVTNTASTDSNRLNNLFVIGTSSDMPATINQQVEFGEFFSSAGEDQKFAVIGSSVAHKLFGSLNPVGSSIQIMGENFTVRGVLAPSSGGLFSVAQTDFNSAVFIPFKQAKSLAGEQTNILQILVKSRDTSDLDKTVADVKGKLLETHSQQENFTVLKQYELLNLVGGVVNTITGFITGIAAISLLVGGIGIMNIMLASVSERTREIGIRKALGATNRQILNQFLVEGLALSLSGGLIGITAAMLVYGGLKAYTDIEPIVTAPVVALAVGVSVAIGVVFSVAPALKAARKDPIEALRNQ